MPVDADRQSHPDAPKEESSRPLSRRQAIAGAAGALGAALLPSLAGGAAPGAPDRPVPPDATKVQGPLPSAVGRRSPFERPEREAGSTYSRTPLQDLDGIITPSDLHYERHHGGVAMIDPARHTLLIHGRVERPTEFTLEDLKRLPSISRILFLECSGNFSRNAGPDTPPQEVCGLTSTSEWTGVPLSVLFREVGASSDARWFLAEGGDAAVLARSIPMEKALDDAFVAYAQNGEALRPENGYPMRLLCPGWEGNTNVKWLRRLELAGAPFMTREETSKYTEALKGGRARQFSFVMDARSIITRPCYPAKLAPGWQEIRGIAWSGRGRIARAELSFDEGASWQAADLQEPVLPKAHTRFRFMWNWDGRPTTILSRATDETGYVQPTQRELIDARGPGSGPYHLNPITGWRVAADGSVSFRTEAWT